MNLRTTTWAMIFVTIFLVITKTTVVSVLVTFLITGIIPGTNLAIPSWILLIAYPIAIIIVSRTLLGRAMYFGEIKKPAPPKSVVSTTQKQPTPAPPQSTTPTKRRARVTA